MIFIIIGLCILLIAYKNFKKGFLYFLIYKIFLVTNITIISIPGIPLLSLNVFMTLFFLILYRIKYKELIIDNTYFPFTKPFKWLAFSWFFSTIFAHIGFTGAISQLIKDVSEELIFILLIWRVINRNDVYFLIKGLSIAFLITCIYGFYEKSINFNPLQQYELSIVDDASRAIDFTYTSDSVRGYRVQSVFEHAIGAGINWALYIIMFLTFIIKYKLRLSRSFYIVGVLSVLLSVFCLFFSNSRGPVIFLLIGSFSFVDFYKKKHIICLLFFVIILLSTPLLNNYIDNVISIFDSNIQEKIGGSSVSQRFEQLDAAIELMWQSPIVGFGFKFINTMHNQLTLALLGLESMWFKILTHFGLLGILANLILAYFSLIKIPKDYKSNSVFFLSLAYWITASLTSVPGMLMYLYYLLIILFIKCSPQYIKTNIAKQKYPQNKHKNKLR